MNNKLISYIKAIIKNTSNPLELFMYYTNIKKEVVCKLRYNMGQFSLNQDNKYLLGRNVMALDYLIKNKDKKNSYI